MQKKTLRASVPMALVDALPVLCFGASTGIIAVRYRSWIFALGALCCLCAGLGKVLWKLCLAVAGRDVPIFKRYFRILMPGGFLLMLLSVIPNFGRIPWKEIGKLAMTFPCSVCFVLTVTGFVAMGLMGAKLDSDAVWVNWLEQCVNLLAQLCLLLAVFLMAFSLGAYPAGETAAAALVSDDAVTVTEEKDLILFDGAGEETLMILYPGAAVAPEAYAPLMRSLAEQGTDACIIRMPFHFAMLGINRAADIMKEYPYEHYILGGHSLGGVAGSFFASKHSEGIDRVVLLASYSTQSLEGMDVVSVYGTEDGVLNAEAYEEAKDELPEESTEIVIEGGNHAGFADYGPQEGDGEGEIPAEEQQSITAEAILSDVIAEEK